MSKNSDHSDQDLTHEPPVNDPLAVLYTELVTPDIAEINEHAAALEEEDRIEPDRL